jgi:hypothetical protein
LRGLVVTTKQKTRVATFNDLGVIVAHIKKHHSISPLGIIHEVKQRIRRKITSQNTRTSICHRRQSRIPTRGTHRNFSGWIGGFTDLVVDTLGVGIVVAGRDEVGSLVIRGIVVVPDHLKGILAAKIITKSTPLFILLGDFKWTEDAKISTMGIFS